MHRFLFITLVIFLLQDHNAFGQVSTDEQLATQYLETKEYDKAVVYFEKLFSRKDGQTYYDPYLFCLLKLQQFEKAEKLIKRQIKQQPKNLHLLVDLGTLYKDQKQTEKGNEQYTKAIRLLPADQQQVLSVATEFIRLKEWDFALETYRKGKKLMGGFYPFSAEIAEVYMHQGNIRGMVNEYLSLLELGDDQMQAVQNGLQPGFGEDQDPEKNEIIRTELLKKVQENPDRTSYTELLIWFFIQEKNFSGAFVQSRALDKRNKEDGSRMMVLGALCLSNDDFENAAKCYRYVLEKGRESLNYVQARMELLNTQFKKVTTRYDYTTADLEELQQNYDLALQDLGRNISTASIMKNQAYLYAFYMNDLEKANSIVNLILKTPAVTERIMAESKILLGDILLMKGEIWDASLLYSQVELAYKHDVLGNEAKFKNARLSYFKGEFKWAQSQLNVLKGSTEKLIANDAMELSILISDNLKDESVDSTALSIFAQAELLLMRNETEKTILFLDSILRKFPSTPLADDIHFRKFKVRMKKGQYTDAAVHLQAILDNYSFDILGDDALFNLAELNERYLNNPEKARQLYEELLNKYPGSTFTIEARKRFRKLRGDAVN